MESSVQGASVVRLQQIQLSCKIVLSALDTNSGDYSRAASIYFNLAAQQVVVVILPILATV